MPGWQPSAAGVHTVAALEELDGAPDGIRDCRVVGSSYLAVLCGGKLSTLTVWDLRTGAQCLLLSLPCPLCHAVTVSSPASVLVKAVVAGSTLRRAGLLLEWKCQLNAVSRPAISREVRLPVSLIAAFFNDAANRILAQPQDEATTVLLLCGKTGALLRSFAGAATGRLRWAVPIHSLQLFAIPSDLCITLWAEDQRGCALRLQGHSDVVTCATVSEDGELVASGSADATIRVWDLPLASTRAVLRWHTNSVLCLRFSSDQQLLYSLGLDHQFIIWDSLREFPFRIVAWDPLVVPQRQPRFCGSPSLGLLLWPRRGAVQGVPVSGLFDVPWAPAANRHFPAPFRAAVRSLLLCCCGERLPGGGLPADVVRVLLPFLSPLWL